MNSSAKKDTSLLGKRKHILYVGKLCLAVARPEVSVFSEDRVSHRERSTQALPSPPPVTIDLG